MLSIYKQIVKKCLLHLKMQQKKYHFINAIHIQKLVKIKIKYSHCYILKVNLKNNC